MSLDSKILNDVYVEGERALRTTGADITIGNVGVKNASDTRINPSTEEKQDDIITELETSNQSYTVRSASNATYEWTGLAVPGTSTSAASWRVMRETLADGTLLYADGDADFDNVWDNYSSLSYS